MHNDCRIAGRLLVRARATVYCGDSRDVGERQWAVGCAGGRDAYLHRVTMPCVIYAMPKLSSLRTASTLASLQRSSGYRADHLLIPSPRAAMNSLPHNCVQVHCFYDLIAKDSLPEGRNQFQTTLQNHPEYRPT